MTQSGLLRCNLYMVKTVHANGLTITIVLTFVAMAKVDATALSQE